MKTKNLTTFFTFTSLLLGLYTFGISRAEVSQATVETPSVQTKNEKAGYGFFEKTKNYGFFIGVGSQRTTYEVTNNISEVEGLRVKGDATGNFIVVGYKTRPRFTFVSFELEVGEAGLPPIYLEGDDEFEIGEIDLYKYQPSRGYSSLKLTLGLQLLKNFAIYSVAGIKGISMMPYIASGGGWTPRNDATSFTSAFLGAGLEAEITPHIVLFAEYAYVPDKHGTNLSVPVRSANSKPDKINIRQAQMVQGGLKVYF